MGRGETQLLYKKWTNQTQEWVYILSFIDENIYMFSSANQL